MIDEVGPDLESTVVKLDSNKIMLPGGVRFCLGGDYVIRLGGSPVRYNGQYRVLKDEYHEVRKAIEEGRYVLCFDYEFGMEIRIV